MPPKNITRFSSLQITSNDTNKTKGLYAPKLTSAQRDAIDLPHAEKLGGIIYNTTTSEYEIYKANGWTVLTSGAGGGDVVGPNGSRVATVPIFADNSGKLLEDSQLIVRDNPNRLRNDSDQLKLPELELSGLTYLNFSSSTSAIYVDALSGIQFITNNFGSDSQVCSLLTSGLPSSSTSPNALLELQSTNGAFLMSRMNTQQRDALSATNGMILYNTTTNKTEIYENNAWISISSSSGGDVVGPASSAVDNLAVFADSSGKKLSDSGISMSNVYSAGSPTYFIEKNSSFYAGTGAGNSSINAAGTFNVGVGINVLTNINNGNSNVAVGIKALQNNLADENTAIGANSLINNSTGSSNTAVGNNALSQNTTNSRSTAVGSHALFESVADDCTAVGGGSLQYNLAQGSTAVGSGALSSNTQGENNSAFGYRALFGNVSGSNCTAFGHSALSVNTAHDNTAFGAKALESNSTGTKNLAIGFNSLRANLTGSDNISLGNCLFSNTSGSDNIAIGNSSLASNITGSSNIAIGSYSISYNIAPNTTINGNTAIGYCALQGGADQVEYLTGSYNVAVGYEALQRAGSCSYNVAIGSGAMINNHEGSFNVAIGAGAGGGFDYNNCVFIGANASGGFVSNSVAIGSNSLVIANNSITLGNGHNVGIGNNGATYALDIGSQNKTVPLIRIAATSIPNAPPTINDGLYFNNQGQASYKSQKAIFSGNLVNANSSDAAAPTCGFIQSVPGNTQGSLTINTTAVKSNSIILTTIYSANSNGPSLTGSVIITNINPGVSFSVQGNYTPSGPTPGAFWLIINPT